MRRTALLLLAPLLLSTACPAKATAPQPAPWAADEEAARVAFEAGRFPEAERRLKTALVKASAAEDPVALANLHYNLGRLYTEQHRLELAREQLDAALALEEPRLGPEDPAVLELYELRAVVDDYAGDYPAAEKRFRELLARTRKAKPEPHEDLARAILNLAVNLGYQQRDAEAETLYREALGILRQTGPEDRLAHAHQGLGIVCYRRGDLACAKEHYRKALAIREQTLGPEHPYVATVLFNLSGVLLDEGDHAAAEATLARCVRIREKALPPDHPFMVNALVRYAEALRLNGKEAEADAVDRRRAAVSPR